MGRLLKIVALSLLHTPRQKEKRIEILLYWRRSNFPKLERTLSKCDATTNDGCHFCTFSFFISFSRNVSGNNKTPPQARLGTIVVCWDDDGRFSLLPIRFFFLLRFSLFSRRFGRTYTTYEFFSTLSRDCVAVVVVIAIIADQRFPLAITVSQFSWDESSFGSAFGKIVKFSHCAFITDVTHCGLNLAGFQTLLTATTT